MSVEFQCFLRETLGAYVDNVIGIYQEGYVLVDILVAK
jgi:hypothetical protein